MLTVLQAFWHITLFRLGPEDLPDSRFFLAVAGLFFVLAESVLVVTLYPLELLLPILLLDTVLLTIWTAAILLYVGHMSRLQPTLAALFGSSAVLQLLSYPLSLLLSEEVRILPLVLILLWSIAVYAHIFSRAAGWSYGAGVWAAVVYVVVSFETIDAVLPST